MKRAGRGYLSVSIQIENCIWVLGILLTLLKVIKGYAKTSSKSSCQVPTYKVE
uniref:Uncharacterized protein n=1 Tax=Rhizophora mucronata TaxID=61149 RepID=A0A2P2QW54_RHIMU